MESGTMLHHLVVVMRRFMLQVSGETEHPNLPELVLSFQPMDFSAPTWVRRQTDQRRRRERPRVLVPGEGTFTEYK